MPDLPKPSPEDIVRLHATYAKQHERYWKAKQKIQDMLDGRDRLLKVVETDEYRSPVTGARPQKDAERIISYEPKPHIEPENPESDNSKDLADAMETDSKRWLKMMVQALVRAPWRDMAYNLVGPRGKAVGKGPYIPEEFREGPPERKKGEPVEMFAQRAAEYAQNSRYTAPFIYESIDPLNSIVHPLTGRRTPPWVIQVSQMDVYEVMDRWPFWTDPLERTRTNNGQPVVILEYCSRHWRVLLADGEPVTRESRTSKRGDIMENKYGRVYYDILYSPWGTVGPGMGGPDLSANDSAYQSREERMAVTPLDLTWHSSHAKDKIVTYLLFSLQRYGLPVNYGEITLAQWEQAVKDGYMHLPQGANPPGQLKQDAVPGYVTQLLQEISAQEDFATLPPVAVGLGIPNVTSGVQQAQVMGQVDIQSIMARDAIAHTMERALGQCWYQAKYLMDSETCARATDVKQDSIPDVPHITVDMEPPDENKRARNIARVMALKDYLDVDTILKEAGYENTGEIDFNRRLDVLKLREDVNAVIASAAMQHAGMGLATADAKAAAKTAPAPQEPSMEAMAGPQPQESTRPAMPQEEPADKPMLEEGAPSFVIAGGTRRI